MITGNDGTVYTVHARQDGTYAVEVSPVDGGIPSFVGGFKTREEAEQSMYELATGQGSGLPPYAGPARTTPGV